LIRLQENVSLREYTTIGLGGPARYFSRCASADEIRVCHDFAESSRLPVFILGGGSNVIFPDEGYPGLVLQIGVRGIEILEENAHAILRVGGGESWDCIVEKSVKEGLCGIECLSGIPGSTGAVPVQNVGAYGQEVAETIVSVQCLEFRTGREVRIPAEECDFSYRSSRFKGKDRGRYIILSVDFRLKRSTLPQIRYAELEREAKDSLEKAQGDPASGLMAIRQAVLRLRKKKSMVIDPEDPNTRSVGSFFLNPVFEEDEFVAVKERIGQKITDEIPIFRQGSRVKIPAAWLIEKAGFQKGFRLGGAGISTNHSLALVNFGSSSFEILSLAAMIRSKIESEFGVALEREPVVLDKNGEALP